ncbi:MAG: SDR family NAD(P)-dependent oxidoreductase [Thermoleophilaceae bacterium]
MCDVTDEEAVASLMDGAIERHGRLDVMVANAGVGRPRPLLEMDLEEWRSVTSVNLDGVFLCTRHAGRVMSAAGGGVIVNMCSITAFSGFPMLAHYAAAKAGVRSLTQTAAVELRDAGVRVNCVCPGFVGTDMVEELQAAVRGDARPRGLRRGDRGEAGPVRDGGGGGPPRGLPGLRALGVLHRGSVRARRRSHGLTPVGGSSEGAGRRGTARGSRSRPRGYRPWTWRPITGASAYSSAATVTHRPPGSACASGSWWRSSPASASSA